MDVNTRRFEDKLTALWIAAFCGFEKIFHLLLDNANVDCDASNDEGQTALFAAANKGQYKAVQMLLSNDKVDCNAKSNDGYSALYTAAYHNRVKVVQMLLDYDKVDCNTKSNDGYYALWTAANQGHDKVVRLLLAHEAVDLEVESFEGYTALTAAADFGYTSIVVMLIEAGADLSYFSHRNIFNRNTYQPVVLAELEKHGVTRNNVPKTVQQSKYYFMDGKGEIYLRNVRRQRWMNREPLIMCMHHLYSWSQLNQDENDALRSLPADLSGDGLLIAGCFMHVDGGSFDNGIARLITQFFGGFKSNKSAHALIGAPVFGKRWDGTTRCSHCIKPCKLNKDGHNPLYCCGRVGYCSKICQIDDFKSRQKKTCLRAKKNKNLKIGTISQN